jgi:hypothetical protein
MGNIVVTTPIYIQIFDKTHAPVADGTVVKETHVSIDDSRHLVADLRKHEGFTDDTVRGYLRHNPDYWQHVFSRPDGYITRTQTLQSGNRTLNWTATQDIHGTDIYSRQTGYFW